MTRTRCRPSLAAALAGGVMILSAAPLAPAQDWRQHAAELGGKNSAAAEAALLALQAQAQPALAEIVEDWDEVIAEEPERMIAALRVIDLLGRDAAELQETLGAILTSDNSSQRIIGQDGQTFLLPLLQALGSTTPHAKSIEFHQVLHHTAVSRGDAPAGEMFRLIYRYSRREKAKIGSIEQARNELANDKIFQREVAAEYMRQSGTQTDAELLRDRLLDRDRRPEGWDGLSHNGVTVPIDDDFALAASLTLVQLAPDDAISAIGHANLAHRHPHRSRRIAALGDLARFGPDAGCAVPELLAIAKSAHPEEAAEALKVLGMCGREAGAQYLAFVPLTKHTDPRVKRRATSLVKMLTAMGFDTTSATDRAAATQRLELAATRQAVTAAVAALTDKDSAAVEAAELVLAEKPKFALPALLERLANERNGCPERAIQWIARLGVEQGETERHKLCYAVAVVGETWAGPMFSSSTGGGTMSRARIAAYGDLWVGRPSELQELTKFLDHKNGAVRHAAARELAARSASLNEAPPNITEALWQAVTADHPKRHEFHKGAHQRGTHTADLTTDIQTAAAIALASTSQPDERHTVLLGHALRHQGTAAVTAAIHAWSKAASRDVLETAAKDRRAEVAQAGKAALAASAQGK